MSRHSDNDAQFSLDLDDTGPAGTHRDDGTTPAPTQRRNTAPPLTARDLLADTDAIEQLLALWQEHGWIRPLDREFARLIRTLTEEQGEAPRPLLILLAALVSHQVGRGHVCVDLQTLLADAGQTLSLPPEDVGDQADSEAAMAIPRPDQCLAGISLDHCQRVLEETSAVSPGDQPSPLVYSGNRLYLRRFWRYELSIAGGIRHRLSLASALADPDSAQTNTLREALTTLFPQQQDVDYQKLACALAARNRFAVITGGPGTGKTTTVVNLLAALQAVAGASGERRGQKYRIRLAAPTGKAAARLNESIGGAVSRLPLARLPGQVSQADIPTRVTTLHRLLGSRPDSRRFRHHRDNPLLVDILVIDEASMVDVDLMASVVDALPETAHLILLGDKDQLASVDAGAVLGELCRRADRAHYRPDTADWLRAVTGDTLPPSLIHQDGFPMDQCVTMLRKSYRFGEDSGIGRLASAVNEGNLDPGLLNSVRQGQFEDVAILPASSDREDTLSLICRHALSGTPDSFPQAGQGRRLGGNTIAPPAGYRRYLELMRDHPLTADSPLADWDSLARQVLQAFGDFQILCALRRGPWGVEGLNERIAQQLLAARLLPRAEGWYPGRPVLVTGNDYNLGLMNGDIGITFNLPWDRDSNGETRHTLRVAFPANDGSNAIRWISPSRLQQLETVYAMTVHKSQGSEFTHTALVLPDRLSPVLTRELVYTGITRARHWFSLIAGDESVLRESTAQRVERASGLAQRLWS